MTNTFTGEIHPFAEAFPMLPADDLQALANDIGDNGLLHPVVLDPKGVLLDGRNRLHACGLVDVEPTFVVHEGDPLALIVSANTHRRQMTAGQIAAARAIALAEQGKRENGRWKRGALSQTSEVSGDAMQRAGVIWDHDRDLLRQVTLGAVTLADAYEQVNQRRKDAETKARQTATLRDEAPDLAGMVTDGALPLAEAWSAYEKRTEEERRARKEREDANRDHFTKKATAIYHLALARGANWMDEYDPELLDPTQRNAFTVERLTAARDHIEEILTWTKTP